MNGADSSFYVIARLDLGDVAADISSRDVQFDNNATTGSVSVTAG